MRFVSVRVWCCYRLLAVLGLPGLLLGSLSASATVVDAEWSNRVSVDTAIFDAELVPMLDGFDEPLRVTHAGDGSGRLFVVEKAGRVWVVQSETRLAMPFLDISDRVLDSGFEQGLFSVAFHPEFETNGYFFVVYTGAPSGNNVLARYRVLEADPNVADPSSEVRLFDIPDRWEFHNGGDIAFSPIDGYLYYATGDGGAAGDPAQDPQSLFGKILRLDVDGGTPYAVPGDNPFVSDPGYRPEIWALGLRNPWRFSFDRETGDLFIGDVGSIYREELNRQPASSQGGENYGWPIMEGKDCNPPETDCDPSSFILPLVDYSTDDQLGAQAHCAITAGAAYRGKLAADLGGNFLFGDWCSGHIWMAYERGDGTWLVRKLADTALQITSISEDASGDLYVTDMRSGVLYRLLLYARTPPLNSKR